MEHAGRQTRFSTKDRIAFLYDGIGQGLVKIPELDDIIPHIFGKDKGIGRNLRKPDMKVS